MRWHGRLAAVAAGMALAVPAARGARLFRPDLCTSLDNGRRCAQGRHHYFVAGFEEVTMTIEASTREGCREHQVSRAQVEQRWRRASELATEVAFCECCLGPARAAFVAVAGGGGRIGVNIRCARCATDVALRNEGGE